VLDHGALDGRVLVGFERDRQEGPERTGHQLAERFELGLAIGLSLQRHQVL